MRVLVAVEEVSREEFGAPAPGVQMDAASPGSMLRVEVPDELAATGTEFYLVVKVRTQAVLGV